MHSTIQPREIIGHDFGPLVSGFIDRSDGYAVAIVTLQGRPVDLTASQVRGLIEELQAAERWLGEEAPIDMMPTM